MDHFYLFGLLSGHSGMNDLLQDFQFPGGPEDDFGESLTIDGPVRGKDSRPKLSEDIPPCRLSRLDDGSCQLVGINDAGAQ